MGDVISEKWKKASVIGSLWASLEILVGSFLHNIGFPLAGTVLSMSSVVIMIAFLQIWPERGIIWRASLITALMKSISPSAIIIGPMTGILAEGILIEMAISIFGVNAIGVLIGGAVAVFSTILHKVATLLIIYGFDLIKIFENLYYFAVKQIGHEDLSPIFLLLILSLIYVFAGLISALLGYYYGKKYISIDARNVNRKYFSQKEESFFSHQKQQYSVLLLFSHLIFIIVIIYLVNSQNIVIALIFVIVYTLSVFIRYKNSIRHLKKMSFWAQALFITFVAALFWNGYKNGNIFHPSGLIAGLKLNLRAVVILVGFSALSVELRSPIIQSLLFKQGFRPLYESVQLAFSALPFIIENTPSIKDNIRRPFLLIKNMLELSEILYAHFSKNVKKHFIICGGKQQGKTQFASKLIEALKSENYIVGGFLSKSVYIDSNKCVGYELEPIGNAKSIDLCTINRTKDWPSIGRFYFNPDALKFGKELVQNSEASIIFIDEVGRLEINEDGWFSVVNELENKGKIIYVWLVRHEFVSEVKTKFNQFDFELINIKNDSIETALLNIKLQI